MGGVFHAWNDPGNHPAYHNLMKDELRRTWPVLAKALDALPSPEEEEEFVAIGFDSGTTYALTGANAGHWVEGAPTHIPVTVTDAQVETACSAHATTVGDPATWEWIVRERPDVASRNRKQMRAALEAAIWVQP